MAKNTRVLAPKTECSSTISVLARKAEYSSTISVLARKAEYTRVLFITRSEGRALDYNFSIRSYSFAFKTS